MARTVDFRKKTLKLNRNLERVRKRIIGEYDVAEHPSSLSTSDAYNKWLTHKADDFRQSIRVFAKVYNMIAELDKLWRALIYSRGMAPSNSLEIQVRGLYALWLSHCNMYEERAAYFGRHKQRFDLTLDELARYKREATAILRAWDGPVPALAPSFRPVKLSAEATARVRALFPGTI